MQTAILEFKKSLSPIFETVIESWYDRLNKEQLKLYESLSFGKKKGDKQNSREKK